MGINKDKSPKTAAATLRRRAEDWLQAEPPDVHPPCPEETAQRLIHELEVHRVELEMQNEELRQSRDAAETALKNYSDLYDFAPVGYFALDRNGVIRRANLAGACLIGGVRSQLIGRNFGLYVAAPDRPIFTDFLGAVLACRVKESCEVALSKGGSQAVIVQIEAMATASGEEFHLALINITDRKRADKAQALLSAIVESSDDAIIAKDLNGVILNWNAGAERLFGYRATEIVGKPITVLIPPELHGDADHILRQLFAGERIDHFETVRLTRDGRRIDVSITISPILLAGQIIGASKIVRDISGQKRAKEQVQRLASFPQLNPNPVLEVDTSGNITFYNPATKTFLEKFGIAEENVAVFIPPDLDAILKTWDGRNEATHYREITIGDKTLGETIQLAPQFNAARIYSLDITEQKRAENMQRASEERVRLKLESILFPEGNIGNLELGDTIDTEAIQSLMDDFYKLVPMPMAILDLKGRVLVGKGWQNICLHFHRVHPETHGNCLESDLHLTADIAPGEFRLYKCKNNMWDVATPIMVGDVHVGNLFSGQFFFDDEPLDYDSFRSQAGRYGFNEDEYIAALECVPRMSRKFLASAMEYFIKLAAFISKLSYGNIKLARSLTERDALMEALRKTHDELEQRVADRTEELAAIVDALRDEIVERERMAAHLLRLNRLYAVLGETNQAIIRADNRDSLFHDLCRIAVEQGGFLLSWVGLLDEESGLVRIVAACGAIGYLENLRISTSEEPTSTGPTGISIREGTYYICNDFLNDPCTQPWHERGRTHGLRASASVAVKEEGRVIGALTLYAGETDFFDRQQVELIVQMGDDISFALDNMARETRRQNAEQALQQETFERLWAVEALRENEQMLLQQNRLAAMGEMINNIAHQWRQPLNVLALLVQQIQLFYDSGALSKEELDDCVSKSMSSIDHMSQTIDDFRNFFKPDKKQVLFKIGDVVAKTVALVETSFESQGIRIDCHAGANPALKGFPNEYSQVLLNILSNARDALQEKRRGGATIVIAIGMEEGRAVVTISDNAGGIPEEFMDRIFEPYFTTKGPDKGTGVGLFMSKTIIEKNMNGRLTVRNTENGAEFRIECASAGTADGPQPLFL